MTVFGDLEISTLTELPAGRAPDRHPRRAGRRAARLPRPGLGARPRGGRRRAGRRTSCARASAATSRRPTTDGDEAAPARRRAGREAVDRRWPCSTSPPRLDAGPARAACASGCCTAGCAPDEKDDVMRRFAAGRPRRHRRARRHHRDRGRRRRAERHGHGGHGRRPLRGLPAAPAARPGGPRRARRACACWSPSADPATPARERLDAVAATTDGFELSRLDLEQRREGDVLGASQSGRRSSLRLLAVLRDEDVIVAARTAATDLVARRPRARRGPGPAPRSWPPCSRRSAADYLEKS